ncbi:MAG: hypothetical protein KC417_15345, partial [Myxococcales bacterium]|nr:hypothetical protein [Myxococcales bacterium]
MRGFALHIRLLASVLLRHWRRSELRPGRGGRSSLGRASAGVMLRMFLACYVTFGAFQWGALYADAASGDVVRKGAWLVGWAFVLAVLYGFLARAPRERAVRPVFQNPFLEALPLHRAAVGVMHVLVYVLLHVAFGTLLAGYATGGPAKYMAGLGGFALSCMAFAFGSALAEVMRVTLSVERAVIVSRWLSYSTSVPTLAL